MEALVACALLLMIGAIIMQVVIPMARGTVRGTQQVELQQIGALALRHLCEDVQTSASAGITVSPAVGDDPLILAIHPLRGLDSIGDQVWADQLILYWWKPGEDKLWRTTWPHGGLGPGGRKPAADEPFRPTLSELRDIVSLDNEWRRVEANQVKEFKVDFNLSPASISLSVEAPAPDSRPPESFLLTRRVSLRNERS
jgi:hypothetical protein